ncbi:TerC family protein [Desulfotomaculum copahuensis]|uniref:Tellurium resistance protein TerC n=1 Tax=Desulfotomaculum copahuensis TaxID=1838280 RepID=A0A1B7LIG8_9FIRM|nr:TerC family protein [Desulfotomaculum copahuensis]OAT86353.1 hypothetical protein A6M21_16735 [Desulfotomaculum copahuensis]
MDFFSGAVLFGVVTIILSDLLLAGDNALIIGLACRGLPRAQKYRALFWGMAGAVILRILLTSMATILLTVPFVQTAGGILLAWVAFKLLLPEKEANVGAAESLATAIKTIITADLVMSMDNVLAVAGAAHGEILLVVGGLVLSIPIVIGGSQVISRLVEKYPVMLYAGAAVLAWTAGKMLAEDRITNQLLARLNFSVPVLVLIPAAVTLLILIAGWFVHWREDKQGQKAGDIPVGPSAHKNY